MTNPGAMTNAGQPGSARHERQIEHVSAWQRSGLVVAPTWSLSRRQSRHFASLVNKAFVLVVRAAAGA
jgi:hypothetical protein